MEPLIGSAHEAWLLEPGRPAPGEALLVVSAAIALAIGTRAVWLNAAVRSLYGPGPRRATTSRAQPST